MAQVVEILHSKHKTPELNIQGREEEERGGEKRGEEKRKKKSRLRLSTLSEITKVASY
jgi:hypothetical protein